MSDLHINDMNDEQLRIDLEQAQKSEQSHKNRANELEAMVEKLEAMLKDLQSVNKEQDKLEVEDLLERQNEKLEDKLTAVREQLVLERQSARTANLNAWKLEKQLEDLRAELKVSQRRLELTEHRLKNANAEHDNTKLKHKQTILELKQSDEQLQKLEEELNQLKQDLQRERQKRNKCEEELIVNKSKVLQHIGKICTLETNANEASQNMAKLQAKYDEEAQEFKRVQFQLKDAQLLIKTQSKEASELQTELRKTKRNYLQLKEACHITDTQLTEVEELLHKKQERVSELEASTAKLEHLLRKRNETISELQLKSDKQNDTIKELHNKLECTNKLIIEHEQTQQQMLEQLNLLKTQHQELQRSYLKSLSDTDVLKQQAEQLQRMKEQRVKELQTLKDENSQLLTQLYYAKEKQQGLQVELETLQATLSAQRADIEELHNVLTEKEQFYLQRNIKSDTIVSQQKKLIDYLQIKVDDLTTQTKRKKTLVDRIFGVSHANEAASTGSVPAHVIEAHILYRTLKAELQRAKEMCEELQRKIDASSAEKAVLQEKHTNKCHKHQFELKMNQVKKLKCAVCSANLHVRQHCWQCKECGERKHKKCYEEENKENKQLNVSSEVEEEGAKALLEPEMDMPGLLNKFLHNIFNVGMVEHMKLKKDMIIYCAHEIEEQKLLLLGTELGLFCLHVQSQPAVLTRIQLGMDTDVRSMAVSPRLAKMLFVSMQGTSLSQCDYRMLQTRCRSNDSQNGLESVLLDLNLSNRSCSETWEHVYISNATKNPIDSVAIAVTAQRIVLLKYDETQQFMPVRAMNTEAKVSAVLFTSFSAILASNKYYEVDLETYATEEFLEVNAANQQYEDCHPVFMVRVSDHEFLLCFMELGVFVDEFGSRSRPIDLQWQFTPTGFFYNAPYLYISHFQSIQVMRLTKSFTHNLTLQGTEPDDSKSNTSLLEFNVRPIVIYFNQPLLMPTILAKCGVGSIYLVTTAQGTDESSLSILEGRKAYKVSANYRTSLESITSVATSLTSANTCEEESK